MKKMLKLNSLIVGLLTLNISYALPSSKVPDPSKSPLGCRNAGFEYNLTTISLRPETKGKYSALYFMYNRLNTPVQMYQLRNEDSIDQINVNHVIQPHTWAALSIMDDNIRYACAKVTGNSTYGTLINCADAVKVCEYVRVKYGLNNQGNFWIVNGNTSGGAVQEVLNYGIIPR